MDINCHRLKLSLRRLVSCLENDESLIEFVRLNDYTEQNVDCILGYLMKKLLDPKSTEAVAVCFPDILLAIVVLAIPIKETSCDRDSYLKRSIALSKLIKYSPEVLKYSVTYFADKKAPFKQYHLHEPAKRSKTAIKSIAEFDVIKCSHDLLVSNPPFFKDLWDWSEFVEQYNETSNDLQRLYCNQIFSVLFNLTPRQLNYLNKHIPEEIMLDFHRNLHGRSEMQPINEEVTTDHIVKIVTWNFSSSIVTNIEGIMLPLYNAENAKFYNNPDKNFNRIVRVESTKTNLKNIAMGLSSDKAICLVGPVGCGKTTLVEHLARKTGRIAPNSGEINSPDISEKHELDELGSRRSHCDKRKVNPTDKREVNAVYETSRKNGFLRIQLGDQTDTKLLLGQYRCTDVPGEFVWFPGVLTQAVMKGFWLLLEDIDLAPQDTCSMLSNLLETKYLSVPGFRDSIKISPGFQLFVTVRSPKSVNNARKSTFILLEKYFYCINIISMSRKELCQIVTENFPKLATIANRIVDIYLMFSSGNHLSTESARTAIGENSSEYVVLPTTNLDMSPISAMINSGRTVSTRDLMKLCDRSYATYSATSTEYAYFVFQNAVDVFCSYIPYSVMKRNLIVKIGARLGIIQSRCEYFSNDYRPSIEDDRNGIKLGRTSLNVKQLTNNPRKRQSDTKYISDVLISKKSKLDDSNVSFSLLRKKKVTFSFTRLACCLLERIGVCISQAEPILLVGETGVGKTSCVQYLAAKTNHRLVVVNMNNQSDISDLVGGFKPVDISYILSPIRHEFESLFRTTFNENKNEKFLSNVSACYNRGEFHILIKLMLKIVNIAFQRVESEFMANNLTNILNHWNELKRKLIRLNSQLEKSLNVSFAFIAGSLVKCIQNGDWVLLDEINLASDETLECLSTILEREGSVVLLEKGELAPVKRHPEFRIFACMNPRTDVGKKDLPTGIRNRFTEFFVDELRNDSDLRILVGDYLKDTGISATKISSIVKLYGKLKSLSEIDLNDGLGNKPIYSLRTLCRALTICARNLCGSIERNLYESFCLSFLTQLDNDSHKIVLDLIRTCLLSNSKAVLSQQIPKPGTNFIDFEGYWIEKGTNNIIDCYEYILTDTVRANLKDIARIISIGKLPILLQGPTSAGKTSLLEYIAKKSGNNCLRINNHEHTDLQEYIGTYIADSSGKLIFKEGILVEAMRNGHWIILDELNLAPTDILEALNRVLDDNRELYIPETQNVIKAHANFMLFATQNPPGLYGGRKTLSRAFKNRFIELHFSEIPKSELEIILEKRCQIPKSYSQKMVKCMYELQINRKTTSRSNFTLRDLFRWGNRYTYANEKLLAIASYDWNQHLVDEGYLILSSNIRTKVEVEIIEETLFKNFRKKVNLNNLYSYHENTSLVTKSILKSLVSHTARNDIIWTENMTRMAVLTAKALEFHEPALLVGPTGCGKTTICQILAEIRNTSLRILNCHMHTEGADFLGGLRPCRRQNKDGIKNSTLFEWVDGPLIEAMLEGTFFMADEISLAEDSVLERLNSVLESSRTIVLAEKGGVSSETSQEFIIHSRDGFEFLATMNPGGDFGKKELSPALRNRFTEIWCLPSDNEEDLIRIANNALKLGSTQAGIDVLHVATLMVKLIKLLKTEVEKFNFSVRDILAWVNYISVNAKNPLLTFGESFLYGFNTLFLDSLEILSNETEEKIKSIKSKTIKFALQQLEETLSTSLRMPNFDISQAILAEERNGLFGIEPFFVEVNKSNCQTPDFAFNAPTTKANLLRLLSALSVNKAILLEGPPGVGKTSIVENLARKVGCSVVRINLCEHTDLADLFGTDLPAEDRSLDLNLSGEQNSDFENIGSFAWRDGPLLSALKATHTWVLLDELNLAPQSVLEGLNAILDHRGEVYIPELNKSFTLQRQTKIFACQNPLRQGGGRKGLPQSFLNRFTKVYLSKLTNEDLLHVIKEKFLTSFEALKFYFVEFFNRVDIGRESVNLFSIDSLRFLPNSSENLHKTQIEFDLLERMVQFSVHLDRALHSLDFGIKGGPFEINLRDLLRWCEFLFDPEMGVLESVTGLDLDYSFCVFKEKFQDFLLVLYERMKLIYYQRMRSESDRIFIQKVFSEIFECDAVKLNELSQDVSLYWTDSEIFLNDIVLKRVEECGNSDMLALPRDIKSGAILLSCQMETLKNVAECVNAEKVILLSGPSNSGKTKILDAMCEVSNQCYDTEIIEDSVMGSFQQIDLVRHLEEVAGSIEYVYTKIIHKFVNCQLKSRSNSQQLTRIMALWHKYSQLSTSNYNNQDQSQMSEELLIFKKRINTLQNVIIDIKSLVSNENDGVTIAKGGNFLKTLEKVVKMRESLMTGGHFEWVDSKIVKCLKSGGLICLEHANLCSPAILDRLNPAFEPNGCLLLSEKGLNFDNQLEIVCKHKSFRAFLTIDPKNGELSRAMRNRCVELDLSGKEFCEDDYRQIVYLSGVREHYLIDAIIKMYKSCNEVAETEAFNISHLKRCAFLVACNKRAGFNDLESVSAGGAEVFVNASTIDLLGFGLEFYKSKLREIVYEESRNIVPSRNICSLDNVILNPKNLNQVSLVKMQCEPLVAFLKCYPDNELTRKAITSLFASTSSINIISNIEFIKCYIGILYAVSSKSDLTLRYKHISYILQNNISQNSAELTVLSHSNECVYRILKENMKFVSKNSNLPWNTKLFPRIRSKTKDNTRLSSERTSEMRLTAMIHACLLAKPLDVEKRTKLNKISAICYSKGAFLGDITDSFNNFVLKQVWPLLSKLEELLHSAMPNINLTVEAYPFLILSFMWYNRLYSCSKNTLLLSKELNNELIDKLLLHMKWVVKNLIKRLEKTIDKHEKLDEKLTAIIRRIESYVVDNKHPLNLLQKKYSKTFTCFAPRYSQEQVESYVLYSRINEMIVVVPNLQLNDGNMLRKVFHCANTLESNTLKNLISEDMFDVLKYVKKIENVTITESTIVPEEVQSKVCEYFRELSVCKSSEEKIVTIQELALKLETIYNSVTQDDLDQVICHIPISELLSLKEYFATRALLLCSASPEEMVLNETYFSAGSNYSCSSLLLIKMLMSVDYRQFKIMWQTVLEHLVDVKDIDKLLIYLSPSYYRNFSTFSRVLLKMLQSHRLSTQTNSNLGNKCVSLTLTDCLYLLLFQEGGGLKPITINELDSWRESLNDMCHLVWKNSVLISDEFITEKEQLRAALLCSQKLSLEIEYLKQQIKSAEEVCADEYDDLEELLRFLHVTRISAINLLVNNLHPHNLIKEILLHTALINSVLGVVELCVNTYLPLIDPVEKNRLKNLYENENQALVEHIISTYDLLRIVMRYKGLANEEYEQFVTCLDYTQKRLEKMAQKLAMRPEKCIYKQLAEHIGHFLKINAKPKSLLEFIKTLQRCVNFQPSTQENTEEVRTFFSESNEAIKRIDLWIANSQRFLFDLKKKFAIYYSDFTEPLECCTIMTQTGLIGLKELLLQHQNSFRKISDVTFSYFGTNGWLCETLQETFQFPNIHKLNAKRCEIDYRMPHVQSLIADCSENLDESVSLRVKMLSAAILDTKNEVSIACLIDERAFSELQSMLSSWNEIWRVEEERKKKKQIEEESLYVNKVHCKTENEEEMEIEETEKRFPINVQEDFGEYLANDSLEQIKHIVKDQNQCTKAIPIIKTEEHKHVATNFMFIMEYFTRIYYYKGRVTSICQENINYVVPFTIKLDIFSKIINKYRLCLNAAFDSAMYSTYIFIIGLQQDSLKDTPVLGSNKTCSNFYKDPNISEIRTCLEIMEKVVSRTNEQLALYPDHAVLIDILRIVDKIKSFSSTSPVARFNTGFQILRHKLSQWNELAHKRNHFRDLEAAVAEYVQRWTKLELNYWRNCLQDTYERVQDDSYKYFSYLYNLLHEYIDEKYNEDVIMNDVINAILRFVESSNYADFSIRMNLLRSFELYLHHVNASDAERKDRMIAVLRNSQIYFSQFHKEIENAIKTFRMPIEKNLRELVKIESYNKDLSYFSMKNNITRVHRSLNKLLKEYENQLKKNISPVFQQIPTSHDYNLDNDKGINLRYDSKHKYYMVDAKNFVARPKLGNVYKESLFVTGGNTLLSKCEKLFSTSRSVVQETIKNIKYPQLINSLDLLLMDQVETCEHMSKLEVDRSKPKPKQRTEAKNILSQKKKCLSDLYKTLSNLGANYKTGLMELSLNRELTDHQIKPFCIKTMFTSSKGRKLDQNLICLSENLDLYYAKCIFRLKLLLNAMLTPNQELGSMNIDRIKGFSVDMFLLVQKQRQLLGGFTKDLYDLRKTIEDITIVLDSVKDRSNVDEKLNFEKMENDFYNLRNGLCAIQSFVDQYILLIKCKPHTKNDDITIFKEDSTEYENINCTEINATLCKISTDTQKILQEVLHSNESEFINMEKVEEFRTYLKKAVTTIKKLRDEMKQQRKDHFTLTKPLNDLLDILKRPNSKENFTFNDKHTTENIDNILENIIYSVLLSLQKIYKKNENHFINRSLDDPSEPENAEDTCLVTENHLKEKICGKMISDIEDLRILELNKKLSNVMLAVKYIGSTEQRLNYVNKLRLLLPILEQFGLMGEFYLLQQLGAHKVSTKMVSVMLTVFVELATKGFCIPPDLMQDEKDEEEKVSGKRGEGFGLEDGSGENDVSDKIESEDQLDDAKKPEDRKNDNDDGEQNVNEEKGIEMSEDFDANLQDVNKEDENASEKSDDEEAESDKQMGEVDDATEKLDDQIWGSEGENEDDEDDNISDDEESGGKKHEEDKHNDAEADNAKTADMNEVKEGLDATEEDQDRGDERKQNDIDSMKDLEEGDNDQVNPYHNELDEPAEPEEMNLENCNLDGENKEEEENVDGENPFDIDQMKDSMEANDTDIPNEDPANDDDDRDGKDENDSDSESDPEYSGKDDSKENRKEEENIEENKGEELSESKQDAASEENQKEEKENFDETEKNACTESKDELSIEDNVQSSKDNQQSGSVDQVAESDVAREDSSIDVQDTGEDKANVGQAENDCAESAHQGVSDSNQTISEESQKNNNTKDKKRGNANEERTLGMEDTQQVKQLKTVDGLMDENEKDTKDIAPENSNEYQHVREAKEKDITTLDGATEDQSKKIQHSDEENKFEEIQNSDETELMDQDETDVCEEVDDVPEISGEQIEEKSNKQSRNLENVKEMCETQEKMEVEGDIAETYHVPRGDDTTAHHKKDILLDNCPAEEATGADLLEIQKMYRDDLAFRKQVLAQSEDNELWQSISNKMSSNARDLCEQLRLILEPTKCTRLKGDYRSGRRINMRKIIPYIASQFRKDKIWLRRTKPAQRDYKITIAIDDSKSMHHNNSRKLTLEAISLVSQALTLLESGKLSIASFGESPKVLLHHTEQLDGPKLVHGLHFDQNQSKIAELVDFVRIGNSEEGLGGDNNIFENLLLIISDGRNIFSEGEQKVKNAIKLARLQRIFLVYVIIDNPENKHSILDIRAPLFSLDRKSITMMSYLDTFPFPYYVIVRDLGQLPIVLSEAMRQWFELVNSDQ